MSERQRYKRHRRTKDRQWFKKHLPAQYIQGFTVHHEWECGETTYLFTYKEHTIITKKERKNENI